MAVSPINLIRISHGMRSDFIVNSLRSTQRDLFLAQARIASGRAFVSPSEDPVAASRAVDLTNALSQQHQFRANLRFGDNELTAATCDFHDQRLADSCPSAMCGAPSAKRASAA